MPTAPSAMQRWFPIGAWLRTYNWKGSFSTDLAVGLLSTELTRQSEHPD